MKRSTIWLCGIALLIAGCVGVLIYGKVDFCAGWSRHYAASAARLRHEATDPSMSPNQVAENLVVADWHEIISEKYHRVAMRPWLPYPGAPLVSDEERATALAKYEAPVR